MMDKDFIQFNLIKNMIKIKKTTQMSGFFLYRVWKQI